jgi:hypothetical protein
MKKALTVIFAILFLTTVSFAAEKAATVPAKTGTSTVVTKTDKEVKKEVKEKKQKKTKKDKKAKKDKKEQKQAPKAKEEPKAKEVKK